MKPLTAQQLADILHAQVVAGNPDACADAGVCTDTRALKEGCLFIALRGENFDANLFAPKALEQGAAVAIVEAWSGKNDDSTMLGAVVLVPDTLLALQALAAWWRTKITSNIVALTGSNGKTSTKDFTASVLAEKYSVNATRGNLNNHIGLPLTVLETTTAHTAAVYEMGMNHPGEIAPLAAIAQAPIAIITNVGSAHIEFMESREAIATEKASIAAQMSSEQTLILPHDCDFMELITASTTARIFTVGGENDAVRAENIHEQNGQACYTLVIDDVQRAEVILPVNGSHMITNSLLAAAAGYLLRMDASAIAHGLTNSSLTSGRLRRFEAEGVIVFDDTYNANPESVIAGLQTLAATSIPQGGKKFAVLGRMAELGVHAAAGSQRVGECAASLGIKTIAVGDDADLISRHAGSEALHFSTRDKAADWLRTNIKSGDAILFKGSRTSAMERVMKQLFPTH